ncbi:N-alpha-acetyltransferase 30 [Toxocara canis]|uniref:N-terminal methionine N(alpha)-acetyltransferase NatC n=1 Tax=Toxocara canis TaxID=6265 RepID=A0A0B2VCD3_TOXCA|nr:N-alpha-acetyltransferase 30 [Toxocara canis]
MARISCSLSNVPEGTLFDDTVSRLRRCLVLANGQLSSEVATEISRVEQGGSDAVETCNESMLGTSSCDMDAPLLNGAISPAEVEVGERPERIEIVDYESELQMADIMRLITKDLSEPYSIYTYRYFIHNWPSLCLLALDTSNKEYVGAIVCKLDVSRQNRRRGYIAMLAVDESCRRLGIGTRLVQQAILNMQTMGCDEVVLETEVTNLNAIRLYTNLGFIREKRLFRYYLNGVDAFRLKLFFTSPAQTFDDAHIYAKAQGIAG